MDEVRRPDWWCYPERCQNSHEWGPGLITVSWSICDCAPAVAVQEQAGGGPAGHLDVTALPQELGLEGKRRACASSPQRPQQPGNGV